MLEVSEVGNKVSKETFREREPGLRLELLNAQFDLRGADFPVLIHIVGDDRIGCNAVLHRLHEWMDARFLGTETFGLRTDEERQRPPMWRYWRVLPRDGVIGIHLGGMAQLALAERFRKQINKNEFLRHLEHVRNLERLLVDDGALILKFWLHLPEDEFRRRMKRARKNPEKSWRVDESDWEVCDGYAEIMPLAETLLERTESRRAPWNIIESTDAEYRDLTVAETVLAAITDRLSTAEREPAPHTDRVVVAKPVAGALGAVDLAATIDRDTYRDGLQEQQARLNDLTKRARAAEVSTVLVFEGWDAAGKGGVIRRITGAMDAREYRVVPIAAPTEEERVQHYLWRFWRHLPRAGRMLIFDRSWYGRVLVERVEGFARVDEWTRAYAEINDFESQLVEHGLVVQKFWLHIDPDEQLRRFQDREKTDYKKHKITDEDYRNRDRWDAYVEAVNEMVARTSTAGAPWHLVPANSKRVARLKVLETVCDGIKAKLKPGS